MQPPFPYSSPTFSPSRHAASLLNSNNSEQSLETLCKLRADLLATIYESTPTWQQLVPRVELLTKALQTTQTAHTLSKNLSHLSVPATDYATRLDEVLHRCAQLSANTALLSRAKVFLQQVAVVDGLTNVSSSSSTSSRLCKSGYLTYATALQEAKEAADHVGNIRALNKERMRIYSRHSEYKLELEQVLVINIYRSKWKVDSDEVVKAVDKMSGEGRAASVIIAKANTELVSALREAFVNEGNRTVVSLANSSFSVGKSVYVENAGLFIGKVMTESRISVEEGMGRVKRKMMTILRRIEGLGMKTVKEIVWEEMEMLMKGLISAILGIELDEEMKGCDFVGLVEGGGVVRSVYNLEIVYGIVEEMLKGREGEELKSVVCKGVDGFVKAVRADVKEMVENVLGKRKGTLLQLGGGEGVMEEVVEIVNGCLQVCLRIHDVGRRMGEIVVTDVIGGFIERARWGLELASSWTEGGYIMKGNSIVVLEKRWRVKRGQNVLEEEEWEAVIRVVESARMLRERLEKWTEEGLEEIKGKIGKGCEMLDKVVQEGLKLLHAEFVWVCFKGVVDVLRSGGGAGAGGEGYAAIGGGGCVGGGGEFDEFGDLIDGSLINGIDMSGGGVVTELDRKAVDGGDRLGEILVGMENGLRMLGDGEREFVVKDADEAVATGIRICGEGGDRDIASAARLFLDATATRAAHILGWPSVERCFSVAEGESASGAECRSLLYKAGLPM